MKNDRLEGSALPTDPKYNKISLSLSLSLSLYIYICIYIFSCVFFGPRGCNKYVWCHCCGLNDCSVRLINQTKEVRMGPPGQGVADAGGDSA